MILTLRPECHHHVSKRYFSGFGDAHIQRIRPSVTPTCRHSHSHLSQTPISASNHLNSSIIQTDRISASALTTRSQSLQCAWSLNAEALRPHTYWACPRVGREGSSTAAPWCLPSSRFSVFKHRSGTIQPCCERHSERTTVSRSTAIMQACVCVCVEGAGGRLAGCSSASILMPAWIIAL